jgi:hypothetical protein
MKQKYTKLRGRRIFIIAIFSHFFGYLAQHGEKIVSAMHRERKDRGEIGLMYLPSQLDHAPQLCS